MKTKNTTIAVLLLALSIITLSCCEKEPLYEEVAYKTYGLCYSPYHDGESPILGTQIPEERIKTHLIKLAQYTEWIRTYSTTDGLQLIPKHAKNLSLKVAAGAWLDKDLATNNEQVENLIAIGEAGNLDVAIVGSEVLLRGDLSVEELIGYIQQVKTALPGIKVTTAEPYGEFLEHPELIAELDVIFAHIYPFWEGLDLLCTPIFYDRTYDRLIEAAQGKEVIIGEAGWPSEGGGKGNAVCSPENAAWHFLNFTSWARARDINYYIFENHDEKWKSSQEGSRGAHWGIFENNFGELKPGMERVFNGELVSDIWTFDDSGLSSVPPSIKFTSVPAKGSNNNLKGRTEGVSPFEYKVAVYIYVNGWWTKPYWNTPLTSISCDQTFTCDITTGGNDANATKIRAYILPNGHTPPKASGGGLPATLAQNAVAWIEVER